MFQSIASAGRAIRERWFTDSDEDAIYKYIDDELPADESRAVEQRMVEDPRFFDKASTLIKFWWCGLDDEPGAIDDKAAALQASRERLWHHGRAEMRLPAKPYDATIMTARVDDGSDHSLDGDSLAEVMSKIERMLPAWRVRQFALGVVVLAIAGSGYVLLNDRYETYRAARDQARELRANTTWMHYRVTTETHVGEQLRHSFPDGSVAVLGANSRLSVYGFNAPSTHADLAVDGDITFTVSAMKAMTRLQTHDVQARLSPGTYRILAIPGSAWTRLTVEVGVADVHPIDAPTQTITLHAGERATFTPRGIIP